METKLEFIKKLAFKHGEINIFDLIDGNDRPFAVLCVLKATNYHTGLKKEITISKATVANYTFKEIDQKYYANNSQEIFKKKEIIDLLEEYQRFFPEDEEIFFLIRDLFKEERK